MQTWNNLFIHQAGTTAPMLGALILMAGVIIMLLGWRLSRLVAVLDFSLFGSLVGASLTAGSEYQWLSAGLGAVSFGALSLWLEGCSEAVASGMIAGLLAVLLAGHFSSPLAAVLLATGVAFGCAVALSAVAYRECSAIMTSVQGGLLAAFGLAACLSNSGGGWWDFRDVLAASAFAQMIFVLAPIGIGVTFQLASLQNEQALGR